MGREGLVTSEHEKLEKVCKKSRRTVVLGEINKVEKTGKASLVPKKIGQSGICQR